MLGTETIAWLTGMPSIFYYDLVLVVAVIIEIIKHDLIKQSPNSGHVGSFQTFCCNKQFCDKPLEAKSFCSYFSAFLL